MIYLLWIFLFIFLIAVIFFITGLILTLSNFLNASSPKNSGLNYVSLTLEGYGLIPVEPGVLLNTLWEHLPNVDCQMGECGGCKVKLLEGKVRWVRDTRYKVNQDSEFLACICEAIPGSNLKCALYV